MTGVKGLVHQMEVGRNGTVHIQGYLYFGPGLRITDARKLVDGMIQDGRLPIYLYQRLERIYPIFIDSDSGAETDETVLLSDNE